YTGLWFDIESVPNDYQHTKNCVTQNYTWTAVGKKVRQGAIMRQSTSSPDPAFMTVFAEGVPEVPYQIVASDYRTYSCVYSCLERFGFRAEFAWVFSRKPTLPDNTIKHCHEVFTAMGVDPTKMVNITQGEECPYYEKIEETLAENEQYLLKILGPYVPTTTTPAPTHLDQSIVEMSEEEKTLQDLKGKMESGFSTLCTDSQQKETNGASSEDQEDDPNSSTHPVTSFPLLPFLLLPFLIY
ncbi:Crustacyanin-C1 subunit-like 4, partial [Homarus americanus]